MDAVPMPDVLDPDRVIDEQRDDMTVDDHRKRGDVFKQEFEKTARYGQQLWNELTAVRQYLHETTPVSESDDAAWQRWQAAYASVTSSLAGVSGDNGFGEQEAQVIAQNARADRG